MKKFLSNLFFYCIKLPVMTLILLIQNTWQILLTGIIFLAVLVVCGLLNSLIPLLAFLVIGAFFPVFFSVRNIKNCLYTLKNGLKADGILTGYCNNRTQDFSEITFTDKNGESHSKKFRLLYISQPEYKKKFTVVYNPEKPDDFYIPVQSLTGCIISLIFSVIIFALALSGLVFLIV